MPRVFRSLPSARRPTSAHATTQYLCTGRPTDRATGQFLGAPKGDPPALAPLLHQTQASSRSMRPEAQTMPAGTQLKS